MLFFTVRLSAALLARPSFMSAIAATCDCVNPVEKYGTDTQARRHRQLYTLDTSTSHVTIGAFAFYSPEFND
jgi:hypothetical protein